ncbi:aspartate 1-decarboxylase [candidate division KSB1 bacterium]
MLYTILKSKIINARITELRPETGESLMIDRDLLDLVDLAPFEKVSVLNSVIGRQYETHVIEGPRQSRCFVLCGHAAQPGRIGDAVTISAYIQLAKEELKTHRPKIAAYDEDKNDFTMIGGEDATE